MPGVLATTPVAATAQAIVYSTYLGGSNNEGEQPLGGGTVAMAVDGAGNRYLTGTTQSADFPTTPGTYRTLSGGLDAFVTKLSPTGALLWSTYLGSVCEDMGEAIAVDGAGNVYVTGRALSGCYFGDGGGVFVAKLDPDGFLAYASVFGGRLGDTSRGRAIAVDGQGQAYVTGTALSSTHDFPTTPGAFRTVECANVYPFANDVFVAKLSADGSRLLYSTIVCGQGDDISTGIAVDTSGNAYVGGTTASSDFPTVNPLQDRFRGGPVGLTGFVFKLATDGSGLVFSTYLGGSTNDTIQALAIDAERNIYVTGETSSQDFPTTAGVVQELAGNRHCIQTCSDAFVTKIDATGLALVYSTYLSGELDDAGMGITVDNLGQAYVVGTTLSNYFPIQNATQTTNRGQADAFVVALNRDATRLLYGTYLGGSRLYGGVSEGWDGGAAIGLDANGTVHVAGYTASYDFPTTPDAFQAAIGGGVCDYFSSPCGDVFVTTIAGGQPAPVQPTELSVAPTATGPGGVLSVTWSGIADPTTSDHLRVCRLGSPGGVFCEVDAWWSTDAAPGGVLLLELPAQLEPGWYEVRLMSPDARDYDILKPIARSGPILVSGSQSIAFSRGEQASTSVLPAPASSPW